MRPTYSILFFLTVICTTALAQDYRPGYIITNNGDSLSGYVAYRSMNKNFDACSFKSKKGAQSIEYSPEQLKGYGFFGDKRYRSVWPPKNYDKSGKVFGKILSEGPLMLFGYRNVFFVKKDTMILLPLPKGRMVEVKSNAPNTVVMGTQVISVSQAPEKFMKDRRYIGILNHLLEDCALTAERVTYTEKSLSAIVNSYNRCKGIVSKYSNPKRLFAASPRVFAGVLRTNFQVDAFPSNSFNPSTAMSVGAGIDISSPRVFDRLFLSLEIIYTKAFYQGYVETTYGGDLVRKDLTIDISYAKFPIGFRYSLFGAGNTPYIKGGVAFFNQKTPVITTFEERIDSRGNVFADEYEGGYDIRTPRSFWFAAGYEKTVVRKARLFMEVRAEHNNGFIGSRFTGYSSANELTCLAGVKF